MKINKIIFIGTVTIFYLKIGFAFSGPHWNHEEQAHWGAIEDTSQTEVPLMYPYAECSIGKHQSPIDFAAAEINNEKKLNELRIWYDIDIAPIFFNSGHGVQVNTSLDYRGEIEVGEESYPLIQFHFHEPSEHVVGDKKFDAELHYVHVREDGKILVLAVVIEEGKESTTFQTILDNTPGNGGDQNENTGIKIDPASLLPSSYHHRGDFFSITGSLTTPPCSEGVAWYVLPEPITISTAQLEQLKRFYTSNARQPQDLNGRVVLTK
ncbi:carbonic anhydrase [Nitrosomonas aestuarii]|uniref:carbonic anhydrase n=1 Tax=Nitrosomonas aestuarii TaxID=52441 RepID=A0A1I4HE11_9PROT|nr:carbonic anhydrase family protein [Nitrosomonas aestuarii]SFL40465.1 carbonic anhydrase [Nitrosomonas aestuarii]